MRIKGIWRNFIARFHNTTEPDRKVDLLKWAKARRSVNLLVDRDDVFDWLDGLMFDAFQHARQEAKKGNLFEFGYYVGAMDQTEAVAGAIRSADKHITNLEDKEEKK